MNNISYGRIAKDLLIEQLQKDINESNQVFVTSFDKISVNGASSLRKKLRGEKTKYRVVKNSLIRRVFSDGQLKDMASTVDGQCGLGISDGEVSAVSKTLTEFAKENESFEVKSLFFEGRVYDANQVKEFAKLPSREELLAKVCGGLISPMNGMVGVLSGLIRNLASVIDQIKSQKGEA